MALTKTPVQINFSQGLDTKTDKNQLQVGKFLTLVNSVFDTAGRLTKRNGFANITTLPNANQTTLTTLNDNLLATGSNLYSFNSQTNKWINQGTIQPISLSVQSLVRNSSSQSGPDCAVASTGLACLAWMEGSSNSYYEIVDSTTGIPIVSKTALPGNATNPRVYILDKYFIITYKCTISAVVHLQYIAIPIMIPIAPLAAADISTSVNTISAGYDAVSVNNTLFISWAGASTTIKLTSLSSTLIVAAAISVSSHTATLMSVVADTSQASPIIWISFWDSSSTNGYSMAYNTILNQVLAPTQIITTTSINEITSIANNMSLTFFYENANTYASPYPTGGVKTDFITTNTISQSGTVGFSSVILRSVGLASKAFVASNGTIYMLATYGETNQPTYFLIDASGNIYMRLAYSNGGGYKSSQVLPSVSLFNGQYCVPYLFKDFLASVNKGTNLATGTPVNAIYTQTGINMAMFTINASGQYSLEIADALHLTGGQLWEYDAVKPVEHGFHVWPENVAATTSDSGGNIAKQMSYYVFTYEWTDNQGMLHRSAPSIPLLVDTTGSGTTTNTNTLYVPTLRLTYKISPNPVRIVGYRWSTGQQIYYQFTSITTPTLNDPTVDFVTITDTLADSSILGNTLLYTTGGVVENIAAPASIHSCLFKNRLVLIDAEDPNLLWYSKQIIEGVPVEMSDLFTIFIAPTSGAQGSTGPCRAVSAMDDKLIIFKSNAIYYVTGNGPDNTGASNDFSDPIFITSSVGCTNPASIVLMPQGLMFQSEKGIWLLGRDLTTTYIGAPVEAFNSQTVLKSESIPATNQVRMIIPNGLTLIYDYFYQQWGTFTNIRAISSTLYQNFHTYLNAFGQVFQEAPGTYTDGSAPVLMSFQTGPISLAGLRGYERFYFMFLLGTYFSPFKLNVGLSYDYSTNASQSIIVIPDNFTEPWGDEQLWGSAGPWGGPGNVFQARIFPKQQKCQTFNISVQEVYDPSLGVSPGQGLTLSGINAVVGVKKGYSVQKASRSFG